MKRFMYFALCAAVLISCGTQKKAVTNEATLEKARSLEGEKVNVATFKTSGFAEAEGLSEDGTKIVKIAYKWFAGTAKADDKQLAIEIAQREAMATLSNTIMNIVKTNAEKGALINNSTTQQALTSHWEQTSMSIQRGCEPFGDVEVQYSPSTRLYEATAKIGIRGDKYNKMLEEAGRFKPSNLSGEDLQQFIETNKAIIEAAKGE